MAPSEDTSYLTTTAIVIAILITGLAILLRFLARTIKKISFGADDYTMVGGAVRSTSYARYCHIDVRSYSQ